MLSCSCGKTFKTLQGEQAHRHHFPLYCYRPYVKKQRPNKLGDILDKLILLGAKGYISDSQPLEQSPEYTEAVNLLRSIVHAK